MGLLWPRLRLTASQARISSRLAIGGALSAWTANLYGAIWGAGGSMVPIATGGARGTALQERLIGALLVAAALCLVGSALLTVWGLRGGPRQDA
jgi:hypothetical protein